jgi:tetratricopeptide (TPR) repeat protein
LPRLRGQASLQRKSQGAARQVSDLSVLARGKYANNPGLLDADLSAKPDLAQLEQQAADEASTSWAQKQRLDIGIVTLIAVVLTLLGLSLTVGEGIRKFLVWPAVFLVAVSLIGFGWVWSRPVARTPAAAMNLVVAGDRLNLLRYYAGAVEDYTEALNIHPDYPAALVGRANSILLANSPERQSAQFVFTTSTIAAYRSAIVDYQQALQTNHDDYLALVNLGASYFHTRDYASSVRMSREAIDLNPGPPLPWVNLGLGLLSEGETSAGLQTYAHAIQLTRDLRQPTERSAMFSSALTALEILAAQQPHRVAAVRRAEGMIVAADLAMQDPHAAPAPQATVSGLRLSAAGPQLGLRFRYASLPANARLAWFVYFQPRGEPFWIEQPGLSGIQAVHRESSGTTPPVYLDRSCPVPGTYRADIYAGSRRIATAVAPSSLPGETLIPFSDVAGRVELCRPAGWKFSAAGAIDLTSPDQQQDMTIRVTPVPASGPPQRALLSHVLHRMTSELSAHATVTKRQRTAFGGVRGTEWALKLPGRDVGAVWASRGTDGTLRTLAAKFPASGAGALNDVARYLHFR